MSVDAKMCCNQMLFKCLFAFVSEKYKHCFNSNAITKLVRRTEVFSLHLKSSGQLVLKASHEIQRSTSNSVFQFFPAGSGIKGEEKTVDGRTNIVNVRGGFLILFQKSIVMS